jgi:4-hydroxyacetophenone monooxygenase
MRTAPTAALIQSFDDGTLRRALNSANLPSLLSVLYQLTGDDIWLRDPYRPSRTRGLEDNDSGGFPDAIQSDIREAAFAALTTWAAGQPMSLPAPTGARLVDLMSANVGEPVSEDFEPMMAADMGFRPLPQPEVTYGAADNFVAVIIGAGVSGMAAAISLQKAGIPFTIIEKNNSVGGTWLENRYPGCGVDTPSYLYSFTFQAREWTTHFGKRDEVAGYFQDVAVRHDLAKSTRFDTEVTKAEWDESAGLWALTMRSADGTVDSMRANVVITAVGQLNRPKIPSIPGIDDFAGPIFHSARWPEGLDVSGQRVAIVGTGASAMQIAPAIVDEVEHLTIFQRSPQWIAPNDNYFRPVPEDVHWLLANIPLYRDWYRFRLAWNFNDKVHASLEVDPNWTDPLTINAANDGHRRHLARYLEHQLEGRPDLIQKALPTYPPFGKRMLLDNGWFQALKEPHVDLVTSGVAEITNTAVVADDGTTFDVDVIVFATGFDAQRLLHPLDIVGRNDSIRDVWGDDDPRAFLGMSAPGFPNLFFMYGPNTNLGHGGSWITMAECQARYVSGLLSIMIDEDLRSLECRPSSHEAYNRDLDETHARMVWTHPAMDSWYRNAAGRVVTNSPWRVADYWRMTQQADLVDYVVTAQKDADALR